VQQAQRLVEHRREHLLAGGAEAASAPSRQRGLHISRYQSQSSFQKKSRAAPIAADGL
jgi:hypothetical protein